MTWVPDEGAVQTPGARLKLANERLLEQIQRQERRKLAARDEKVVRKLSFRDVKPDGNRIQRTYTLALETAFTIEARAKELGVKPGRYLDVLMERLLKAEAEVEAEEGAPDPEPEPEKPLIVGI